MSELIHKTKVVPFLNTGTRDKPSWTQIKKSTSFTLSMNPQTKTFDFISSETPQDELDSYKPSLSQSLTMFKGEPDYEEIFRLLFGRATGERAHRDALIVFYKEKLPVRGSARFSYELTADTEVSAGKAYYSEEGGAFSEVAEPVPEDIGRYYERVASPVIAYKAWKTDALVIINQMDTVNASIDFDLSLGDVEEGAVDIGDDGQMRFRKGKDIDGEFVAG